MLRASLRLVISALVVCAIPLSGVAAPSKPSLSSWTKAKHAKVLTPSKAPPPPPPAPAPRSASASAADSRTKSKGKSDGPSVSGKVAVLGFTGDGAARVQQVVVSTLRTRGLQVTTSLRPVDSAEQYREMSVALNLVAYIDGEVTIDGNDGSATIYVRNGATGMRTASATVAADRHQLAASLGKELWERLGPALSQACADAAKPRKVGREPMRINAGTPLTATDTAEAAE